MSALTHLHTILDNAAAGVFRSAKRKPKAVAAPIEGPPDDPVQEEEPERGDETDDNDEPDEPGPAYPLFHDRPPHPQPETLV